MAVLTVKHCEYHKILDGFFDIRIIFEELAIANPLYFYWNELKILFFLIAKNYPLFFRLKKMEMEIIDWLPLSSDLVTVSLYFLFIRHIHSEASKNVKLFTGNAQFLDSQRSNHKQQNVILYIISCVLMFLESQIS